MPGSYWSCCRLNKWQTPSGGLCGRPEKLQDVIPQQTLPVCMQLLWPCSMIMLPTLCIVSDVDCAALQQHVVLLVEVHVCKRSASSSHCGKSLCLYDTNLLHCIRSGGKNACCQLLGHSVVYIVTPGGVCQLFASWINEGAFTRFILFCQV